ncbi:MAG: hypothetical protein ACI8TP_002457 [Acidimicrobiales bacterium]|jgi:hypothetical protein
MPALKRLALAVVVLLCGDSAYSPVAAAPSAVRVTSPQPILLSNVNGAWAEGKSSWLNLTWSSQVDQEDLEIRASSPDPGVTIRYAGTGDHAGLTSDPNLFGNEIDHTSFFVETTADLPETFEITLDVRWRRESQTFVGRARMWFDVVTANEDHPFRSITTNAIVPAEGDGSRNWVDLDYIGRSDEASNLEVTLQGELPANYPQNSFTSLQHDSVLHPDEIDTARVWFDPARIEPGTYEMTVNVRYFRADSTISGSMEHTVTVAVV